MPGALDQTIDFARNVIYGGTCFCSPKALDCTVQFLLYRELEAEQLRLAHVEDPCLRDWPSQ